MKPNFIAPPPRIVHSAEMANEAERSRNHAELIRRLDAAAFEASEELAEKAKVWESLQRRVSECITAVMNDINRYPHTCPRCQGPAYIGAVEVDCAGGCK